MCLFAVVVLIISNELDLELVGHTAVARYRERERERAKVHPKLCIIKGYLKSQCSQIVAKILVGLVLLQLLFTYLISCLFFVLLLLVIKL